MCDGGSQAARHGELLGANQRVFRGLLVFNVGAGSHPLLDTLELVPHGSAARDHVTKSALAVAQPELAFIHLLVLHRAAPGLEGISTVVGMDRIHPTPSAV